MKDKWLVTPRPEHQLECFGQCESSPGTKWRATGNDPYFEWVDAAGTSVACSGGWYWLCVDFTSTDGAVRAPRLYMDYGDGYAEANTLSLAPLVRPGGMSGIIGFRNDVRALRFDPTDCGGEFTLGMVYLRKVSKAAAAWRMLRSIGGVDGGMFATLRRALFVALRGRAGMRGLGDWLYQRYMFGAGNEAGSLGYARWIKEFDTFAEADYKRMARQANALPEQPLISLVMPVYNSPERWLRSCIESVRAQVYANWELCIADDASTAAHIKPLLRDYAVADHRIKVVSRERNGHISAASNSALAMADGKWIALLDHDDELPRYALYVVAEEIGRHSQARLIYSDEDKIDEQGRRFDPYFKPDWNYFLFLGHNMFSHFGVYDSELVKEVGGFREGFEGSQDYDLALRCMERIGRHQIRHIPRVLYHWRAVSGSTALNPTEKNYAHTAAKRSLEAHLQRVRLDATIHAVPSLTGNWRVKCGLPDVQPRVTIVIPTKDGISVLKRCIDSIERLTTYENYEILVVDNQSSEHSSLEYLESIAEREDVNLTHFDEPFNFARINNVAVRHARGDILAFVNNDVEVITPEWLSEMVSLALIPSVGAVGAMLYYPNELIQHAGIVLGAGPDRIAGHAYHLQPRGISGDKCRARLVQEVSAVTAACMVVRADAFKAVSGFDESFAVAFNDVDFCLRLAEAGYTNVWTPNAELFHYESYTRGSEHAPERRVAYARECEHMRERWGKMLLEDPYYHPALSLDATDFVTYSKPRLASIMADADWR